MVRTLEPLSGDHQAAWPAPTRRNTPRRGARRCRHDGRGSGTPRDCGRPGSLDTRRVSRSSRAAGSGRPGMDQLRTARQHDHAAANPAGRRRGRVDVERAELGVLQHVHRVAGARRDPDGARRRNDVGHLVHAACTLHRRHLDDAAGAVSQLRPAMGVGLEVAVRRQRSGAYPHRPGAAGPEGIGVADGIGAGRDVRGGAGHGRKAAGAGTWLWLIFAESCRSVALQQGPASLRSAHEHHCRRTAAGAPAPGCGRDRPGRPGPHDQPLQPAAAGAAVPLAEGCRQRQLQRAGLPDDDLLSLFPAACRPPRGSSWTATAPGRSCSADWRCWASRPSARGQPQLLDEAAFSVVAACNGVFPPVDYTLIMRKVSASRLGHAYSFHGITGSSAGPGTGPLVPLAIVFSWRWR